MNLTNTYVQFKSGNIYKVLKHDNYLHIDVDGNIEIYSFEYSFNNNLISSTDPILQKRIINYLNYKNTIKNIKNKNELTKINNYIKLVKYVNKKRTHNKKLNDFYNKYLKYNFS